MRKSVYQLNGEDGLVHTIKKLIAEGYEVCHLATHSAGLGHYIVDYYGEATIAIDEQAALDDAQIDWNKVEDFTRKSEIIEYALEFEIEINKDGNMKAMIAEFKEKSK